MFYLSYLVSLLAEVVSLLVVEVFLKRLQIYKRIKHKYFALLQFSALKLLKAGSGY